MSTKGQSLNQLHALTSISTCAKPSICATKMGSKTSRCPSGAIKYVSHFGVREVVFQFLDLGIWYFDFVRAEFGHGVRKISEISRCSLHLYEGR